MVRPILSSSSLSGVGGRKEKRPAAPLVLSHDLAVLLWKGKKKEGKGEGIERFFKCSPKGEVGTLL